MDKVYDRKDKCCGCTACANSCPVGAIKMEVDEEGFLYPVIQKELCIDCNKCKSVCQIFQEKNIIDTYQEPKVYACKNANKEEILESSSGGFSFVLARNIIELGGIVFGAIYGKNMKVFHKAIHTVDELEQFRKSKYVQSNLLDVFQQVKSLLDKQRIVLFSGTPCQIGGLYQYLGKDYEQLITIDLICFGVPSPKVFQEYCSWFEHKENERITTIDFRDKTEGWNKPSTKISTESGKEYRTESMKNEYYLVFNSHIAIRKACENCMYTNVKRYSDLSVGDYWGIEKYVPEYNTFPGVSKILVNTEKGNQMLELVKGNLEIQSMSLESAIRPNLLAPLKLHEEREGFFEEFNKNGFYSAYRNYIWKKEEHLFVYKIKNKLKRMFNQI